MAKYGGAAKQNTITAIEASGVATTHLTAEFRAGRAIVGRASGWSGDIGRVASLFGSPVPAPSLAAQDVVRRYFSAVLPRDTARGCCSNGTARRIAAPKISAPDKFRPVGIPQHSMRLY